MLVKCIQCKHTWNTGKKAYEEERECPICGRDSLIDVQQTRLREAWIQYPILPKIPKSIPLTRVSLLFKLWNVEEC